MHYVRAPVDLMIDLMWVFSSHGQPMTCTLKHARPHGSYFIGGDCQRYLTGSFAATWCNPQDQLFTSFTSFTSFLASTGKEALLLMGVPVDYFDFKGFSDAETSLQKIEAAHTYYDMIKFGWHVCKPSQDMQALAGNAMHLRAVMLGVGILLRSLHPLRVREYLHSKWLVSVRSMVWKGMLVLHTSQPVFTTSLRTDKWYRKGT